METVSVIPHCANMTGGRPNTVESPGLSDELLVCHNRQGQLPASQDEEFIV